MKNQREGNFKKKLNFPCVVRSNLKSIQVLTLKVVYSLIPLIRASLKKNLVHALVNVAKT